jgi:dihydroorotase
MSKSYLIRQATVINEGTHLVTDVLVKDGLINKIGNDLPVNDAEQVDARGLLLFPGMIDDQVHFREPGLTHKADIASESRAAVAGGITSFMEMPNTIPQSLTQELLEDKYQIAAERSVANYSFYMGASNDNIKEVLKTDPRRVCGVKVFMGSSTGNMLVDQRSTLEGLFKEVPMLIATHCEDEATIRENTRVFTDKYDGNIPMNAHPLIRNAEACYRSSSMAVELAEKYNTRLHILHLSSEKEMALFRNDIHRAEKRITAEACIHHMWFSDQDYESKGSFIKWNPAVKGETDRAALQAAVLDGRIDVIATDHAPHTLEEKSQTYLKAPSGGPLVQHALPALLELNKQGKISLEMIVDKTAHAVADCFQIEKRGYIREGYYADIVLIDPLCDWTVSKENVLYKCGWSPFEGTTFSSKVKMTWVNGELVYNNEVLDDRHSGMRMTFDR